MGRIGFSYMGIRNSNCTKSYIRENLYAPESFRSARNFKRWIYRIIRFALIWRNINFSYKRYKNFFVYIYRFPLYAHARRAILKRKANKFSVYGYKNKSVYYFL